MKCPVYQAERVTSERQSIEIDNCPKCCGVWLAAFRSKKWAPRGVAPKRSGPSGGLGISEDHKRAG